MAAGAGLTAGQGGMAHRIGPNAILQFLPLLDAALGLRGREALLARADVPAPSPDAGMLPEDQVARLHHAVRRYLPDQAADLSYRAGLAVGDYILAHRIPPAAQWGIRALPNPLGARLLSAAIARHSWTFAGSGRFRIAGRRPLTLALRANPLVALDRARSPQCHWHRGVFQRLFATLVWPDVQVTEHSCCACGDAECRFVLSS